MIYLDILHAAQAEQEQRRSKAGDGGASHLGGEFSGEKKFLRRGRKGTSNMLRRALPHWQTRKSALRLQTRR